MEDTDNDMRTLKVQVSKEARRLAGAIANDIERTLGDVVDDAIIRMARELGYGVREPDATADAEEEKEMPQAVGAGS